MYIGGSKKNYKDEQRDDLETSYLDQQSSNNTKSAQNRDNLRPYTH